MQLVTSAALPMVLLNAIKLKVLDTIAKAGPDACLSAHEIASRLFKLQESVLEGGTPFDKVHGMSGFEYTALNDEFNAVFNKAMVDTSVILMKEMLKYYRGFNNLKSLVDVGGGLGITLNMIVSQYPTIKGINLDLPQVIQHAPFYPGIEHVGGDMFQNIPKGDAIFMKKKVLPFLPDASSLVKAITNLDVVMMTQTHRGKERTEDEFQTLAKLAGFREIRKIFNVCTN
ncbi:hypothetical protein L1987_22812 [Smallanthus sonchifolius]|uniref:Uncharacterized protein n=1 Tax=Smallanthus sonchifolius TaxID=185202 RepID=A0ACB9IFV3_9ASTR|nr:hypothetical protein L1987_22812 [Smallanthus sonchifolius]